MNQTSVHLRPGDRVIADGREGVVESIAFSVATNRQLVTVAFDPRTRIQFFREDVVLLERGAA